MSKEIRVTNVSLFYNDSYVELWGTFDEPRKYYARLVYGLPVWYYVCDPLGYCELDHSVEDDVVFVVCDSNGNELFKSSNEKGSDFPTFKLASWGEWHKIKENYPHFTDDTTADFWSQTFGNGTTISVNKYLLTYMDPLKYEKEIKDMYGYEENWVMHTTQINREVIHTFKYLGDRYYIMKITYEHDVCKKQYVEYWCTDKLELGKWESDLIYFAGYFNDDLGPMYPKNEAINVMKNALKKIYKEKQISEIHDSYGYVYERFISYENAAIRLLDGDYNRKSVMAKIAKEKKNHTFWDVDDPEIANKYPDCTRDNEWNYDPWGRRIA